MRISDWSSDVCSSDLFDKQASARIKVKTRRRQAFVTGRFTVQQGTVRVELRGNTGTEAEVVVSPGNPGIVESVLRLGRQDSDFIVRFHPQGVVIGLDGQVSYETRCRKSVGRAPARRTRDDACPAREIGRTNI